ncbi:poly a polymerase [Culex quinquefasciatus]|uniref:Poly(A) polymerase n=1 Tax=Culex quinquefasciatus TaxID=7176 RepID=B0WCB4_CULQU|nr:poly a polymerase [Culex quinquefasciatus]|eukprot:XP_001846348.1 poly a polymerase [Culex quinquefasciatus]
MGMTSAISLAEPKTEDHTKTVELQKAFEPYNVFEDEPKLNHRMEILSKLKTLVKQWVRNVSISKNMPEVLAEKLGGKIYTFGSYRLSVNHKGTNIDALCEAPRNIERQDYFGSFFELLKKQPEVTGCRAVEEALVPVINMNFDGIKIDLLFARLALKEIPDNFDLREDMLLKNLDPKLVERVPRHRRDPTAEHGIYSNSLGYFGGVSWGMLVARTCQLPNVIAATQVHKFFLVFLRWKWPQPVFLKRPDTVNLGFQVWDSRVNVQDRFHLMSIITPAYPQQNSTFHVSSSTRKVMLNEFNSDMQITDEIMLGKAGWDKLFEAPSWSESCTSTWPTSTRSASSSRIVFFQVHIKVLETTRDGMKIEARHVRRKQLNKYLDPNLLKRERKNQRLLRRRKCANDLLRRNSSGQDLVDRFCNRDDLRSDLMLNNGQAVVHDQPEASSSAGAKSLKRRRNKDQLVEFRSLFKAQEMNRRLEEAVERDRYAVENLIKAEQLVLENSSGNQEILPAAGRQYCSAEDATKRTNDWHQSI